MEQLHVWDVDFLWQAGCLSRRMYDGSVHMINSGQDLLWFCQRGRQGPALVGVVADAHYA
ncbi:hypothetical protein D3C71_1540880 [compost metagenome]